MRIEGSSERKRALPSLARRVIHRITSSLRVAEPDREVLEALKETLLGLHQETCRLLSTTRGPTAEEKKALEDMGFIFLATEAKSLDQVEKENPGAFHYIGRFDGLESYIPPAITVAINPKELFIPKSSNKPLLDQYAMIEKQSQLIQKKIPDARVVMLPASTVIQLTLIYAKTVKGRLFKTHFARTLDQDGTSTTHIGESEGGIIVHNWLHCSSGNENVGALSTIVLVKNNEKSPQVQPEMLQTLQSPK